MAGARVQRGRTRTHVRQRSLGRRAVRFGGRRAGARPGSDRRGVTVDRYLSLTDVARRLGVTTATVAALNLPEPDVLIGRTRGWKPATIDRWNAARPGHGGRPRKTETV